MIIDFIWFKSLCSVLFTVEEEEETSWDNKFKFVKGGEARKDSIAILLNRANSRTFFYSTFNLKNLRSIYDRKDRLRPSVQEHHMVHKAEPAQLGGEVLPLCDEISSDSNGADYNSDTSINKKRRAISRMKELLRWAAIAKSDKGGNKRWKVWWFKRESPFSESRHDNPKLEAVLSNF